jgi:SH3 domain
MYDYDAATEDELSFKEGDQIVVIQKDAGASFSLLSPLLLTPSLSSLLTPSHSFSLLITPFYSSMHQFLQFL